MLRGKRCCGSWKESECMTDKELRTRIHKAVDDHFAALVDDPFLAQRIAAVAKGEKLVKKKFAAFPAVVTMVILLTLTAGIAAEAIGWNVLEWLSIPADNVQDTVFPETTGDVSHPVADVHIHEAVSDGYGVYMSVVCKPKEENVLLLNASVNPRDDAEAIGLVPDYPRQTIGAWADRHGYSMYDVRLYTVAAYPDLMNNTGFDSMLGQMQRNEDGSIVIMMAGGSVPLPCEYQLNYIITPYEKQLNGLWQVDEWAAMDEQRSIRFSIDVPETAEAEVIAEYAVSPQTPTQHINLTGCRLMRTPLMTYAEFTYTFKDAAIGQMERSDKDHFYLMGYDLANWDVRIELVGTETLADGTVQFRYMTTAQLPQGAPDEMELDVRLSGSEDQMAELVTLTRIDK